MVILSLSGSLRNGSSNTAILQLMKSFAPAGVEFIVYDHLGDLPHYNPDLDNEKLPAEVKEFRGIVNRSKAIIISTPEYAHGIPGVLKNALDWLVSTTVTEKKPVGMIFGSSGEALHARHSLTETLKTLNAVVTPELTKTITGLQARVEDPLLWQELKTFTEDLLFKSQLQS